VHGQWPLLHEALPDS